MNHVYRLVWREASGGFVAVCESAASQGKRSLSAVVGAVVACVALSGGAVASDHTGLANGTFQSAGNEQIFTATARGMRIDWGNGLNVAADQAVRFNMLNSTGVALNVVGGGMSTSIYGQILSNGRVVILNPNGVLFGAGSVVSVGSLIASTSRLDQFNSATGELSLVRDGSTASVTNEGSITANGGIVALLGASVANAGSITATGGGVYLMSGERAVFKSSEGSPLAYSLTPSSVAASVVNSGTIQAHGGTVVLDGRSLVSAVVNTTGVLEAGSVASASNGVVRLVALGGQGRINASGVINAGDTGTAEAEFDAGAQLAFDAVPTADYQVPTQTSTRFVRDWIRGVDRAYDGTTQATVALNLNALSAGRLFRFNLAKAALASKHAGTDRSILWEASQAQAPGDIYISPGLLTANITPREIRAQAADKVYDGTAAATVTYRPEDILEGDVVNVSLSNGAFSDKNAGTDKAVTYTAEISNGDYVMSGVSFGSIAQADLTLTAVSDTKVFDGSTTSTVVLTAANTATGLLGTDTVSGLSQAFDSAEVGERTLALASGYTVDDGNNGGNYRVVVQTAAGSITPAPDTGTPPTDPGTNPGPNPGPGPVPDGVPDVTGETGGSRPTPINVDLAGLGDLLSQLPPTAAGDEEDPEKIKARRRDDRSPVRVIDGGVRTPATAPR